jgi:hypothetical protein
MTDFRSRSIRHPRTRLVRAIITTFTPRLFRRMCSLLDTYERENSKLPLEIFTVEEAGLVMNAFHMAYMQAESVHNHDDARMAGAEYYWIKNHLQECPANKYVKRKCRCADSSRKCRRVDSSTEALSHIVTSAPNAVAPIDRDVEDDQRNQNADKVLSR